MTKPNFADGLQNLTLEQQAIEKAKATLKSQGIIWPVPDSKLSDRENYDRLIAYAEKEAALVVSLLRRPKGGERPLEVDNVEPKKEWGRSWYD